MLCGHVKGARARRVMTFPVRSLNATAQSYGLRDYFAAGVPELVTNLYCLDRLIEMFIPHLFSHFKEERISPILFASEWCMCRSVCEYCPVSLTRAFRRTSHNHFWLHVQFGVYFAHLDGFLRDEEALAVPRGHGHSARAREAADAAAV